MQWGIRSRIGSAPDAPGPETAERSTPVVRVAELEIDLVLSRNITPGKVFDLTLPLDQVAEGYGAMDERRAIKTLLRP